MFHAGLRQLICGLACFVLSTGAAEPASEPQSHADEIRALVSENINVTGPGVAVLVARDGVPLHLAGYGLADIKASRQITPDSLFDLASLSKQITGVAILTLVEHGKLKLDHPVAEYLTDFAVPVNGRAITLADLLHHVSGLADYCSDEDWTRDEDAFAKLTPETHLQWLNTTKPRRAPGRKYEYNNTEYALLALLVERISGQTFAEYLREHLFDPAGMRETFVLDGTAKLPAAAVKGYVTGKSGKPERSMQPTIMTGDGNVYSSVRDLARWDAALRQHKIINAESQKLAWSGGRYDNGKRVEDDDGNGYGFGWVVEEENARVSHSGSWNGTSTYLLMNLADGLTVAVLSNDEETDAGELAEKIAQLFEKN